MMLNRIFPLLCWLLIAARVSAQDPQNAPVVFETLIFSPQAEHTHGSSLVSLPNGDLLAVWFQGSGERTSDDVRILGARFRRGAKAWSPPFLMADTYGLPDCNPVLFLNGQKKLFLVWIAVQAHRWECSVLKYRTSVDYEKDGAPAWNWQDNILLAPGDSFASETAAKFKQLSPTHVGSAGYAPKYDEMIVEASRDLTKRSMGWMTRIKPLVLPGRILLPLYSDGFNFSLVALSDDDGTTWRPSLPIVGRGNVQPALVQKKDGSIFAFMRDNGDAPSRIQYSESTDSGMTWTPAQKTDIPNEASVELIVMKDGRWAYLGNDEDDGRYRLSLYLSDDEGKTWRWKRTIENTDREKGGRFSYPCLIQTPDGLLRMTYSYSVKHASESIKYVVVDPGQIR